MSPGHRPCHSRPRRQGGCLWHMDSLTRMHTFTLTHTHTHLAHVHTHSHAHIQYTFTHTHFTCAHSLSHVLTHAHTLSHSHAFTQASKHTCTHTPWHHHPLCLQRPVKATQAQLCTPWGRGRVSQAGPALLLLVCKAGTGPQQGQRPSHRTAPPASPSRPLRDQRAEACSSPSSNSHQGDFQPSLRTAQNTATARRGQGPPPRHLLLKSP